MSTAIKSLEETSPGVDKPLNFKTLKKAKVLRVFKKGDKLSVSNYRSICTFSSLSKVIKKLFIVQLDKYLNKFNILKPCQFGFRAGSSTNLALLSLPDYIKRSIDSGGVVGFLFSDFT